MRLYVTMDLIRKSILKKHGKLLTGM